MAKDVEALGALRNAEEAGNADQQNFYLRKALVLAILSVTDHLKAHG